MKRFFKTVDFKGTEFLDYVGWKSRPLKIIRIDRVYCIHWLQARLSIMHVRIHNDAAEITYRMEHSGSVQSHATVVSICLCNPCILPEAQRCRVFSSSENDISSWLVDVAKTLATAHTLYRGNFVQEKLTSADSKLSLIIRLWNFH